MNHLSPILIPVIAMLIPLAAIIGGIYSQVHSNRLKADQRLALIARGVPLAEIESFMKRTAPEESPETSRDPMRALVNARRTAIVLISVGLGLILFFILLEIILSVRQVLAGAAGGLIPVAIGIGFWIDYTLQKREMARFGLAIGDGKNGF